MRIFKHDNNIIVEDDKKLQIAIIPLWQDSYDAMHEKQGQIGNVIGMIDGNKLGFAQVIDLGYKDSFDYGDFIVVLNMGKKKFKKLCNDLGIDWFQWPTCSICKKTIYGTFTIGARGKNVCFNCDKDK